MSLIPRFLCTAFLFVCLHTLLLLILTLKPPTAVTGCIQFHITTLSSFDVLPPVGPLVIKICYVGEVSPPVPRRGPRLKFTENDPRREEVLIRGKLHLIIKIKTCLGALSLTETPSRCSAANEQMTKTRQCEL